MRKAVAAIVAAAVTVAAMAVQAAPAQADRAADFERAPRALFDRMDSNGDGLIDGAEWGASPTRPSPRWMPTET